MEPSHLSKELQSVVEAIRSSDVVENRVQLVAKLGDLEISDKHDLDYLVENLAFWEDFTCLDITQCMLNKTILHIASKYLGSEISGCLLKFVALGTKATMWCGKHLKMTLMSTEESQEEEHSNLFFQLLLHLYSFSAASFSALTKYPITDDKASMDLLQDFISEQLNLTKDSVAEIKRVGSFGPEILKSTQVVIDGVVRMCGAYSEAVNSELDDEKDGLNRLSSEFRGNQFINITKSAIEKLCDLGIVAANDGGSLVGILNVSWKGVVTLLQLGKGVLAEKVSVSDIVLTLIALVNESLRCAAEAWSSPKETISVTEARRTFLPVKFYLINAVKISSLYPCQTYVIFKEISHCVLKISTLRILLSNDLLKTACEVLTELLEQTSLDLLRSLLNSAQLTLETKSEILDWLFMYKSYSYSVEGYPSNYMRISISESEAFSVSPDALPETRSSLLGRVSLFVAFLKYSLDLEDEIKLGIARKLEWFLDILIDEEVYSSILVLKVPQSHGSKRAAELVWQPMFSYVLHALKTFMIVASSSLAWGELESFLLENLFHPHYLCCEIVIELWCFMVRHAEVNMANGIIHQFCALLMLVASPESDLSPGSAMRKIARVICMFLTYGTQTMVDRVYNSIVGDNGLQISSVVFAALLMEGFPLNMMADDLRSIAKQKLINEYFCFIENFDDKSLKGCNSAIVEVPVYALYASLQSLQISISDVNMKTLKFLVAVTRSYKNSTDKRMESNCRKLLSETLGIISNMKHLYECGEMEEVILELENLFISGSSASDTLLYQCKPNLASFLAGFAHMEMEETEECAKSFAVWELYRMLLRERHWAFVHLAVAAFGYFAAHSNCDQLWRFVPQNAALSYDLVSGNVENVDRFMSELKAFLEKGKALVTVSQSTEQIGLLVKEGLMLKETAKKISHNHVDPPVEDHMEIDGQNQSNKRRKLPDGVSKGMELLQSGLKVIDNGLSEWQQSQLDSTEFCQKFLSHFSDLKDVIAHLEGIAGNC